MALRPPNIWFDLILLRQRHISNRTVDWTGLLFVPIILYSCFILFALFSVVFVYFVCLCLLCVMSTQFNSTAICEWRFNDFLFCDNDIHCFFLFFIIFLCRVFLFFSFKCQSHHQLLAELNTMIVLTRKTQIFRWIQREKKTCWCSLKIKTKTRTHKMYVFGEKVFFFLLSC